RGGPGRHDPRYLRRRGARSGGAGGGRYRLRRRDRRARARRSNEVHHLLVRAPRLRRRPAQGRAGGQMTSGADSGLVAVEGCDQIPGLLQAQADGLRDDVPRRLADKDPTLWGHEAEPEARIRLGWLDLPESSQAMLPRLLTLREELHREGLTRVV